MSELVGKYIINDYINKGSYGSVYSCTDTDNPKIKLAVKVIPNGDCGISSLLEATIMKSYNHPNIIQAVDIIARPDSLYIFMNMGETDMLSYIRKNSLTEEQLKSVTHQCVHGLSALHQQGIIHCDIKPNNILLFPNMNVKIADFSLSSLKISECDLFEYNICATHYRPPEVLAKKYWNQAVDIWSLGCTFYELATGSLLVHLQCNEKYIKDIDKERWYMVTLSAIRSWRLSVGDLTANIDNIEIPFIKPITISSLWYDKNINFRNLVNSMLTYDHTRRPSCEDILNHPYYKGMKLSCYEVYSASMPNVEEKLTRSIDAYFNKINITHSAMISLTKEIYFRSTHVKNDIKKLDTCATIAHKLLNGRSPMKNLLFSPISEIKECERQICKGLNFQLHVILPDQLTCIIKPYREFPLQ